jgi:hypothetical protein
VLTRDKGQAQPSIAGKGGVVRQVLLPESVSRSLLALRGDALAANNLDLGTVIRLANGKWEQTESVSAKNRIS